MSDTLNIIHLPERIDREMSFKKELEEQGITDYKVWNGIIVSHLPFTGISLSHKQIVQDAKERGLKRCIIAEDDIYFSNQHSYKYFLDCIPEEYDLFLGVVYDSEISDNGKILFGLAGLTLYSINSKFYDTFLSMNPMNNLDRELGKFAWKYRYMVCPQFVAHQRDGFSDHKKANATYGHLIEGRKMFGVD